MNYKGNASLNLRLEGWRASFVLILLLAAFMVLVGRAVFLQGLHADFLQHKGEERYSRVIEQTAYRGEVLDRNGDPLAISLPAVSVWASRDDADMNPGQLQQLSTLLEMPKEEINHRVNEGRGNFVYLKRQLSQEVAQKVSEIHIPGLFEQKGFRRSYPKGEMMAHLLGFTDVEDRGQEGAEVTFQKELGGLNGARRVIKDRAGSVIEDVENIREPRPGHDVVLSVDSRVQYLAWRELHAAITRNKAKAGAVMVLDPRTGEVLALANYPDYNPNARERVTLTQLRNRAVADTYEPGSTLKPFTIAAALEAHKVTPATIIQTGNGTMNIGPAVVHDTHPGGALTVSQVIQRSSNVGAARIALSLPPETMWNLFTDVGFGQTPKMGMPGEAGGRVRPYRSWRPIEQATMSYGHGISVSLAQLARSYTIFANEGNVMPLTLLKQDGPVSGRRVISSQTASAVKDMLELVVKPEGTAPLAQVRGFRVAGKTGTAHKLDHGRYSNRYVASFVGFAPASNPRLLIAVMIDEPSTGDYYGGLVAAPVFSGLMAGALHILGIQPDDPASENYASPTSVNSAAEET
jgi:cell division protein FtsI (penicillin-binding protein 3)